MRVFVAGAASWDTVLHVDSLPRHGGTSFALDSYEAVGSTGAGKALNLARLGHDVLLHTMLGEDLPARHVREALEAGGVSVRVDQDENGTERHVNLMTPDGQRASIYRSVTSLREEPDVRALVGLAAESDVVVLNITDYVRAIIPEMVQRRIGFWTDLHDWDGRSTYQQDFLAASHIVLSDERLGDRAETTCQQLAERGALVVCTHGAAGATAWYRRQRTFAPARSVRAVVDTNGAGDAFTAGLIHALALGWPLHRALDAANLAGATAVTSRALASDELTAQLLKTETETERKRGSTITAEY